MKGSPVRVRASAWLSRGLFRPVLWPICVVASSGRCDSRGFRGEPRVRRHRTRRVRCPIPAHGGRVRRKLAQIATFLVRHVSRSQYSPPLETQPYMPRRPFDSARVAWPKQRGAVRAAVWRSRKPCLARGSRGGSPRLRAPAVLADIRVAPRGARSRPVDVPARPGRKER
jgi:hypothetical protein